MAARSDSSPGSQLCYAVSVVLRGECIASDWPVCAISETATPHRMGAALTYARRYALFTLVGIAGEDDIDAPDLKAPMPPASEAAKPAPNRHGRLNGGQTNPSRGGTKVVSNPATQVLGAEASGTLRDQVLAELKATASSDDAAVWAHRILGAKNSLTEADARQVPMALIRAGLPILNRGAFLIRSTSSSWPNRRAWFVGAGLQTPTIYASRSTAH